MVSPVAPGICNEHAAANKGGMMVILALRDAEGTYDPPGGFGKYFPTTQDRWPWPRPDRTSVGHFAGSVAFSFSGLTMMLRPNR